MGFIILPCIATYLPPFEATIPVAQISERYNERRWLLVTGFVILVVSQIIFMEAPNYAVMCVARILQGIGSAIVWTIGLALLYVHLLKRKADCLANVFIGSADGTPEQLVGRESSKSSSRSSHCDLLV